MSLLKVVLNYYESLFLLLPQISKNVMLFHLHVQLRLYYYNNTYLVRRPSPAVLMIRPSANTTSRFVTFSLIVPYLLKYNSVNEKKGFSM